MKIGTTGAADSSTPLRFARNDKAVIPSASEGSAVTDKLRATAKQLNSVFVQQLFTAMRNTVDSEGGIVSGGQGEDMFRSMFDQKISDLAPQQWDKHDALTEAIVRQLQRAGK